MDRKKILVVDDEHHIVRLIQGLKRNGYQVVTAKDGKEALEKIASEKPDLVVLEVQIPKINGFEVLARIRKELKTEKLPVIIVSAKAEEMDVFKSYDSGPNMYVAKPFDPNEVVMYVRWMLRPPLYLKKRLIKTPTWFRKINWPWPRRL